MQRCREASCLVRAFQGLPRNPRIPHVKQTLNNEALDDSDTSSFMRTLNYAITGGQIFRWRREAIGKGEELSSTLWDSLPGVLNSLRGQ